MRVTQQLDRAFIRLKGLGVKRLVSKYVPLFLAYLFWCLVTLVLAAGAQFGGQQEELTFHADFGMSSPEKRLEIQRETLSRAFSEVILGGLAKGWYCPLVLTLATAWIVESLPNSKDEKT